MQPLVYRLVAFRLSGLVVMSDSKQDLKQGKIILDKILLNTLPVNFHPYKMGKPVVTSQS